MLEDYAMKHGFTNLVHFTDDGWSGATFDRPSWNRLVEGVKNGEITACICKDMSRIGRDHLQVGFFTDILFREKEVRFIAINNGIDSDRQETSEFAPFLNIMNEWFVRDTSKKIKAVLKSRGSSGNAHTSNIPPYGYLKDPENPDHWIIDEEAAEVVRRIYRMTIEGKGPYQIARELSEEKIERPSYYLGKKGLGNHASNYDKENPYMWRGNQVTTLIARPEYIGKTVNFRTFKNSYKDKKTKRADKEDWVVFDDTQEPIVDEETWLLAQKLRQNVRKADPSMRISTEGFLQELVRFSIRPFCIPCCNVIISCNAFGPPGHLILAGSGYVNTNLCKLGLNCKSHVLCKRKISPIGVIQGKLLSIFFTDTSAFIHHPSSFIQKLICFVQIIAPCAVISNVCVGRSGCKQAGGRSFVSIGQALVISSLLTAYAIAWRTLRSLKISLDAFRTRFRVRVFPSLIAPSIPSRERA